MSAEAMIGIGMTILSLGVLFLLLGSAQWMRQLHDAAVILLGIGGVMFVLGVIIALMGRSGKGS
ncbi:MAG: hypothetical protein ABI946_08460 [Chthoniobacterales bacterium]